MTSKPDDASNSARWQALVLLSTSLVFAWSTWFSAAAVLPQLGRHWEVTANQGAWLTVAVQIGFVGGALLSSLLNLTDIFSPRHVIFVGSVGAAISNGLLGVAGSTETGMALRFASGFFLAGVYPSAFKLMATWFQQGRGLALGILAGAIVVGGGLPHLINGLGGLDWRTVVYVTSTLTLLGGLIAEFMVKAGPYPFPVAKFDPREAGRAFANRGVRLATFGYIGHMWELFGMVAWLAVFFSSSLEASGRAATSFPAYATFTVFLAAAVGCVVGGFISDRWGRIRATLLMLVASGICALMIGGFYGAAPGVLLAIGAVWGFFIAGDSAQFSALVSELADQAYVGTALTLQLAAGFTVTAVIIWLVPILVENVGWQWAFAFLAPGPVVGVLAMRRLAAHTEAPARVRILE